MMLHEIEEAIARARRPHHRGGRCRELFIVTRQFVEASYCETCATRKQQSDLYV